jgi:enoyl-CoA hydratase
MRICGADSRFHFRQVALGIMTGWGGAARLQRAVGRSQAMRVLTTAATLDATEALRIGLVDEVAEDALVAAQALAAQISRWSPQSIRSVKRAIHRGGDLPIPQAIAYEAELFATTWASDDHAEGVASFFEKRDPAWKGR